MDLLSEVCMVHFWVVNMEGAGIENLIAQEQGVLGRVWLIDGKSICQSKQHIS